MYIKISKVSQLVTLRNVNPFLKKRKIPKEVLYDLQKILMDKRSSKRDYIALFLKPVKNDDTDIMDELQLYPTKAEFSDDYFYTIAVKGKKKLVWRCCEVKVESEMRSIFVVYPMRSRDIFGE